VARARIPQVARRGALRRPPRARPGRRDRQAGGPRHQRNAPHAAFLAHRIDGFRAGPRHLAIRQHPPGEQPRCPAAHRLPVPGREDRAPFLDGHRRGAARRAHGRARLQRRHRPHLPLPRRERRLARHVGRPGKQRDRHARGRGDDDGPRERRAHHAPRGPARSAPIVTRQRGVAAITAILIVAVAASTAALMLSQQSAMLEQASLVAARAQADLFARAGLDWSRGILLQDALTSGTYDGLDEGWAQPLTALPVERAVVSGMIEDEQGKFNLNNLVVNNARSDENVKAFQRLLASLGLAPELADAVVDWIDFDSDLSGPGGAEDAYYLSLAKPYRTANAPMVQVEELYRVRGFDAATVAKLRPYVTALRDPAGNPVTAPTAVNVNTASALVLAA